MKIVDFLLKVTFWSVPNFLKQSLVNELVCSVGRRFYIKVTYIGHRASPSEKSMCSDKEEKRGGKKKKTAALMGYNFAGGTRNNSEQLK